LPCRLFLQVLYSTRKQFSAEAYTSTYTKGERFYIGFRGGFVNEYERFWGLSYPNTDNQNYQEVTYDRFFGSGRFSHNLGKKIFAGVAFYYSDYQKINFSSTQSEKISGTASSTLGLGLVVSIDRRDNQFSPSKGFYFDMSNIVNYSLKDNNFKFNAFSIDARKYNEVGKHIFAHQFLLTNLEGDVPLLEKTRLGGSNMMRGVFQGRYRDNNMWVLQSEYRYGLSRLFKLVYFASAGSTSPEFSDLLNEKVHLSSGVGLRLLLNKSKKIYARTDIAFANNGQTGYYIKISDAF
jgi:outer membrane protein assembly factor BamA